jgi:hypothetical protein
LRRSGLLDFAKPGYGDGMVATVAAVMMVLGGGRSGTTGDAAPGPEMINGSLIGAQGMRAVVRSGKGCVGNRHGVGQNYEVSQQTVLAA